MEEEGLLCPPCQAAVEMLLIHLNFWQFLKHHTSTLFFHEAKMTRLRTNQTRTLLSINPWPNRVSSLDHLHLFWQLTVYLLIDTTNWLKWALWNARPDGSVGFDGSELQWVDRWCNLELIPSDLDAVSRQTPTLVCNLTGKNHNATQWTVILF